MGAVLVLCHPIRLQEVIAHSNHLQMFVFKYSTFTNLKNKYLVHETVSWNVERIFEADGLPFLVDGANEEVALFEDLVPLRVELVGKQWMAYEFLFQSHLRHYPDLFRCVETGFQSIYLEINDRNK